MKPYLAMLLSSLLICSPLSWSCSSEHKSHHGFDGVFQFSTISALLSGLFDGNMSLQYLSRKGNFGLGTLNGLDGELIALDGIFYKIKPGGEAIQLSNDEKTPFAVVTQFTPEDTLKLPKDLDYEGLEAFLAKQITRTNNVQAIRIDGHFSTLKARSIPKQKPPYRKLAEVNKADAVVTEFKDVEGTLVGFRFPGYFDNLNVSGFHFHFIDKERKKGGHVLGLSSVSGEIAIKSTNRFNMLLPQSDEFNQLNLRQDFSKDLHSVEKGHQSP